MKNVGLLKKSCAQYEKSLIRYVSNTNKSECIAPGKSGRVGAVAGGLTGATSMTQRGKRRVGPRRREPWGRGTHTTGRIETRHRGREGVVPGLKGLHRPGNTEAGPGDGTGDGPVPA